MDLTKGKPIEISDKPIFDEFFKKYPPEISELTFTNLFIWRNYYHSSFLEYEDHLLIFSRDYFKTHKKERPNNPETLFFVPPIGPNPAEMILNLFESLRHVEIHRVPEAIVNELHDNEKGKALKIDMIIDRNNWDYVYEKDKLSTLSGANLYRKRKWLKKFEEKFPTYEFHLLTEDWLDSCKKLQIQWCDMNECRMHEDLMEEQRAIDGAFEHYHDLKYLGGLLLVDGTCIAYTLGEHLNLATGVIHIEKALINYEGSYQAINKLFIQQCCEDVKFINREQDLGDPGLRQSKDSYNPHHMVKKSILYKAAT